MVNKRSLVYFLIIFINFQSWTKANDIKEFQIEGMSIGDSALKYFSKDQINSNKYFAYPLKTYFQTYIRTPNSKMYNSVQLSIKDGDNNFIIESIEGGILPIKFTVCKKQKKKIEKEIMEAFPGLKVTFGKEKSMWSDSKSREITTDFYLNTSFLNGGVIRVICVDRSKQIEDEKGWVDSLRVIANSKEFNKFVDDNVNLSN